MSPVPAGSGIPRSTAAGRCLPRPPRGGRGESACTPRNGCRPSAASARLHVGGRRDQHPQRVLAQGEVGALLPSAVAALAPPDAYCCRPLRVARDAGLPQKSPPGDRRLRTLRSAYGASSSTASSRRSVGGQPAPAEGRGIEPASSFQPERSADGTVAVRRARRSRRSESECRAVERAASRRCTPPWLDHHRSAVDGGMHEDRLDDGAIAWSRLTYSRSSALRVFADGGVGTK